MKENSENITVLNHQVELVFKKTEIVKQNLSDKMLKSVAVFKNKKIKND
jgi:hypothetical protein